MNKTSGIKNNNILIISLSCLLISLIMTPWVNVDSLIIPKLIVFFSVSMFFIVYILNDFKSTLQYKNGKILIVLLCLMILSLLATLIITNSPLEQQIFGRTGRGLGLLTEIATLIFIVVSFKFITLKQISTILGCLLISGTISSVYAIFQFYGLDVFNWYTRTNGIIGTLGNPNFQSAFSALTIPASIFYILKSNSFFKTLSISSFCILLFAIYLCQSTQGYILLVSSILIMVLIKLWYTSLIFFRLFLSFSVMAAAIGVLGAINIGPFSDVLYKVSVQSRGEFWRTAISTFKDNPIFGVGLDSFGDYSQRYISQVDASGINEYTDNAHNYVLNYAANNGLIYTMLYLSLTIYTFICILRIIRSRKNFHLGISAIFSFWFGFQLQSLISPGTISLIAWNAIFTGAIIGIDAKGENNLDFSMIEKISLIRPIGMLLAFLGLLFIYPLFRVDALQLKSLNTKDALLAINSATSYPESTLRYSRIGIELIKSGLWDQALVVGRSAVKYNSNSIAAWALVFGNEKAPLDERLAAKSEILRLDPFNEEIRKIELPRN